MVRASRASKIFEFFIAYLVYIIEAHTLAGRGLQEPHFSFLL